jgi:hypothetical protein
MAGQSSGTGRDVAASAQTLARFLTDDWLPVIAPTIRPSTYNSYARNVRIHIAGHPIGEMALQQVAGMDLNRLYADLLAGQTSRRPMAARSVAYIRGILHRAFRDAVRWDRLAEAANLVAALVTDRLKPRP